MGALWSSSIPVMSTTGLVREVTEVLTSLSARLYGRRSARNRGETALRCCTRHGADGAVTARGETGQMRAQMTGEPR
jgi:hypothetical protein